MVEVRANPEYKDVDEKTFSTTAGRRRKRFMNRSVYCRGERSGAAGFIEDCEGIDAPMSVGSAPIYSA